MILKAIWTTGNGGRPDRNGVRTRPAFKNKIKKKGDTIRRIRSRSLLFIRALNQEFGLASAISNKGIQNGRHKEGGIRNLFNTRRRRARGGDVVVLRLFDV